MSSVTEAHLTEAALMLKLLQDDPLLTAEARGAFMVFGSLLDVGPEARAAVQGAIDALAASPQPVVAHVPTL